jgi:hypothetical protein
MAESVGIESVLSEIVGRLMREVDEVIALIQRPLVAQNADASDDKGEVGPAAMPALA